VATAGASAPSITSVRKARGDPQLLIQSDVAITNQIECATSLSRGNWEVLTNLVVAESPYTFTDLRTSPARARFYRVAALASSGNSVYTSVGGVVFDKAQTTLVEFPAGKGGAYTIPNGVTRIGDSAFDGGLLTDVTMPKGVTNIAEQAFFFCGSLVNVTVAASVTGIGDEAFAYCGSLRNLYFEGNAPSVDSSVFSGDSGATVYYLPGATGWGATFGGLPTAVWNKP
jgi:hypothetical protein